MFNPSERELGMEMSDAEVIAMASVNMLSIHEATLALMQGSANMEFDMGAVQLAALLCFPATFIDDRERAVSWVTEVLNTLQGKAP